MSAMGALQIGLLDPIVMMYRGMATFFAPRMVQIFERTV